jgi:tRNA modification GTPase
MVIVVLDAARSPALPAEAGWAELPAGLPAGRALVALNKTDLRPEAAAVEAVSGLPAVAVSALTGSGLESLKDAMVRMADSFQGVGSADGVAINARHAGALDRARQAIGRALDNLSAEGPPELLASDLREALDALGDIAGRFDNEKMLDRLFSQFCIGK